MQISSFFPVINIIIIIKKKDKIYKEYRLPITSQTQKAQHYIIITIILFKTKQIRQDKIIIIITI